MRAMPSFGKKCPNCNTLNLEKDRYCRKCGYDFSSGSAQSNPQPKKASPPPTYSRRESDEPSFPTGIIVALLIGGIVAVVAQNFFANTFLQLPILLTYLFFASIIGVIVIFNWFEAKDPQNKNVWSLLKWVAIIAIVLFYYFFIMTQTTYAEPIMKAINKASKSVSTYSIKLKKTVSFYTCTLSNPINSQECFSEEENVVKDPSHYDTLELIYGIPAGGKTIQPATPEGGKQYTLDITLKNKNQPSEEFEYSIVVEKIEADAADKISQSAITALGIVDPGDLPQTLSPQEFYPFEAVFDAVPSCLTNREDLEGQLYFYVDVTTKQTNGAATPFMLVPNREDFSDEVENFYSNFAIRPGPGPIDVYAFTKPFVIEVDKKDAVDIKIRIENTKSEGTATIQSLTLTHTVEKTEADPFTKLTCDTTQAPGSSVTDVTCPDNKEGNCIKINFDSLEVREDSVYELTCSADLTSPIKKGLKTEKTDDIAVEAKYQYKQAFGPNSAVAICSLVTEGVAGACQGTATACAGLDSNSCARQDGCRWTKVTDEWECVGTPTSCSGITDQTQCTEQKGCSWATSGGGGPGGGGTCQATPNLDPACSADAPSEIIPSCTLGGDTLFCYGNNYRLCSTDSIFPTPALGSRNARNWISPDQFSTRTVQYNGKTFSVPDGGVYWCDSNVFACANPVCG